MDKYLWSFYWDCGRSGRIDGLFVATEKEVSDVIGLEASFGEVLGKHSDVRGTLDEGDITKLDVSPEAVAEVGKHLGTDWSGFNPLDYVRTCCELCGEVEIRSEWICKYREGLGVTTCEECYEKEINKTY